MQERRGTPETNQRRGAVIPRPGIVVFRPEFNRRVFIPGIVKIELVDGRKLLVSLRRKIVPDVAGLSVCSQGAGRVRLDHAQRITLLVRKKIVLQKVWLHDLRAEPCDPLGALRIGRAGRLFARVTTSAAFRENSFAARHHRIIVTNQVGAAWCVSETKRLQLAKEGRDLVEALFGCEPEDGVLARVRNFEWLLRLETDQPVMACEPVFGKHSDVHVNPNSGTTDADRI